MLTNIIFNLKTKNKTIEYYISPLKVSIMVLFTLPYISDNFFYINTPVTLTILFIVYAVLNVLIKNTGLKITYYILFFITLITTTIYNITYQDMLITIATFLGFIALYLFTYTNT